MFAFLIFTHLSFPDIHSFLGSRHSLMFAFLIFTHLSFPNTNSFVGSRYALVFVLPVFRNFSSPDIHSIVSPPPKLSPVLLLATGRLPPPRLFSLAASSFYVFDRLPDVFDNAAQLLDWEDVTSRLGCLT